MTDYMKCAEFKVSEWALHPLIYGDWGELNPIDKFKLQEFIADIHDGFGEYTPLFWVWNEEKPHFAKCDVSGMKDMVYNITMYILK